ncbi:hypothetical protein BX285_0155 [Streptomyces sp. 1114.5]|uniref:hypothetical protein n=1 Tax=unclassified Streptomyces TaxID=2593676 RepID=UPI000BC6A2DF|nr:MULTISPECIES: hypothetical protein [unclassified Streptomyces]RKT15832.1 hypothetical protein BX285_0155 [Streptomyces sp. 1114.5]SOB82006.1 hypothetical protein SAMN06272789_2161 [Streptomyces sp. 1331.2]
MASPGYGKRTAPGELPPAADDFTHLPVREAYLASLINNLPDGAAMDVKTLAAYNPLFGQMAVRTALNRLSTAGHLRRVRERVNAERPQWVFRTYFSRTPRSDAWWNHFIATGESPGESTESAPDPPEERRATAPVSPAYAALAGLGAADSRLALSAADCAALEPLAAEWLARGTTPALFTAALTAGLPPTVHSPAAFTRRRLIDKLPPERPHPQPARIAECTDCRTPCRPQALHGGLCRACHSPGGINRAAPPSSRLSPAAVHRHAARVRQAMAAAAPARRS